MIPPSFHQGASNSELREWVRKLIHIEHAKVVESERGIDESKQEIHMDKYLTDDISSSTLVCMRTVRGYEAKKSKALAVIERLKSLLTEIDSNTDKVDYDSRIQDILKAPVVPPITTMAA
jgi:hypothetical protein